MKPTAENSPQAPTLNRPRVNASLDLAQSNVDINHPIFEPMLRDFQANILKAHGRDFSYHIFLRLDPAKVAETKAWISKFANTRMTSAWTLEQGRRAYKTSGADGGAVFTLSLSATGYFALGFNVDQLPKEQETPANSIVRDEAAFANGAKGSAARLGDGVVQSDWDEPFRGNVDVLIIVADDRPDKAWQLADDIVREVAAFGTVLLNQKAHVLQRRVGASGLLNIEHFGYADGVSQPLFFKVDIDAQGCREHWDDQEPLNLVLVRDPQGQDINSFGSFLVFRKLEQNVAGFMDAEEKRMPVIKDGEGIVNRDLPGAMMVGRFRNGNPLITSGGNTGSPQAGLKMANDFNYNGFTGG
jgi:deferrochelatase/peroxidase EfeB